jgi:outer membrane protein assembly factor BamB
MPERDGTTRRTVLKSLGVAAGVGAVGSGHAIARTLTGAARDLDAPTTALDDVTVADTWPQYQGNAAKTGVASSGPTANVNVAWQYDEDDRYSRVVVDDAVYAATTSGLVSLTTEGDVRWTVDASGEEEFRYSTPAVVDDVVYVGADAADTECGDDTDSALVTFDAETGTELWRTSLDGRSLLAPTVTDGTVYVVSAATMDNDGDLYAVDAETGTVRWRATTGSTGIGSGAAPPVAVADGTVFTANENGLAALDAESGEKLWQADTNYLKGNYENAPTVVDGTVFIGTGGAGASAPFYAINADDGSIEWTYQPTASNGNELTGSWTSTTVASGNLVAGFQINDFGTSGYYALDPEDGSVVWFAENGVIVSPAAAGDVVYTGRQALNAADGSVAWDFGDDAPFGTVAPAVVDDTVYVGGVTLTTLTGDEDDSDD